MRCSTASFLKIMETQTIDGRWYAMRIQPYRTLNYVIEGVVMSFVDITDLKSAQAALRKTDALARRSSPPATA